MVYVSYAFLQKMYPVTCIEEILACIADAILRGYSAYINVCCVEKFQDFSE